ncbi:MAG: twin-arginine translocase subunit TatC [bacterium]|nr:twin-arginine translocase subunit TatC [bacterium]
MAAARHRHQNSGRTKKKAASSKKASRGSAPARRNKKQASKSAAQKRSAAGGAKKSARKKSIPRVVPTGTYRTNPAASRRPTPADQEPLDSDYDRPDNSRESEQLDRFDAEEHQTDRPHEEEYEEPGYEHLPDPYADDEDEGAVMSVGDHLEELRVRIFQIIGVVVGLSVCAGFFSGALHDFLVGPYRNLTDENLILQNVYGPMEILIKVSVLAGVIVGFPAIVFILWGFVTPAVSRRTAIYGHLAVAGSALLFWTGIAVCWFYIVPLSLQFFFVGMQMEGVDPVLSVERYYGFLFALHLATGLAFQLPIVLIALGAVGILTVAWHQRTWRFALVIIYVSSAVITPPDPWSMLGVGTLLSLLYVLSICVVWLIERSRR